MKKIAPIAALVILALGFTSCKKDYSCDCTIGGVTSKGPLGKQKKKDAKAACDQANAAAALFGGSCELN